MKENKMTDFQKYCIDTCRVFLRDIKGFENVHFEEQVGKLEVFYTATIKIADHAIKLYIYADEAGFMRDGKHWTIYEKPDYPSGDKLIDAFIKGLAAM